MNELLKRLRDQFSTFWSRQGRFQRTALIALVITAIIVIPIFVTWATAPTYSVAFSELSEKDAGEIVAQLQDQGVPYKLKDAGTILVPSEQVYEVRLNMARAGLPRGGTVGFELFSGSTLGMTEFTQRVNYQRALEGELERTIDNLESVDAVRVHIVTPERSLLASDQAPTTASITIKQNPAQPLNAEQVKAITHLVASSVENLKPENVVVVDFEGNLLTTSASEGKTDDALSQTDYRRMAELAYSKALQEKVQHLLDSALGPNKSIVQAYVALDWTERQTKSQSFDPASAVLRSSQVTTETYDAYGTAAGGEPGAVTNLPPGVGEDLAENQFAAYNKEESINNYEVSMVESQTTLPPGVVSRISLSVLVDGITDEAELAKIRSAVAAAVGIDLGRGDSLAVEAIDFDRTYYQEQNAQIAQSERLDMIITIGKALAAFIILLAILLYIQRLLRNLRLASAQAWTPVLQPVAETPPGLMPGAPGMALPGGYPSEEELIELPGIPKPEKRRPPVEPEFDVMLPQPEMAEEEGFPELELSDLLGRFAEEAPSVEDQQMQQAIARLAEESPASVAEIIQMWLSEDEK
jgi:flagellar M-ring protein FliF